MSEKVVENIDIPSGAADDLLSQQGGTTAYNQPEPGPLPGGKQVPKEQQGLLQVLLAQFHNEERENIRSGCFCKVFKEQVLALSFTDGELRCIATWDLNTIYNMLMLGSRETSLLTPDPP
jgi:hypothetical protein